MENQMELKSEEISPKLSLLAQFDDLCRFSDYMIKANEEQGIIEKLIEECEKTRINWTSTKLELNESKKRIEVLMSSLDQMKADLKISNQKKRNLRNQSNRLRERMDSIKDFITKNKNFCQCDRKKQKILTYFDINVIEELESDSDTYSSLEDFRSSDELYEMNENYSELRALFDDIDMSD